MADEGFAKPPEHDSRLALRGQDDVLKATTGHVAVHVGAGVGHTVAVMGELFGGER